MECLIGNIEHIRSTLCLGRAMFIFLTSAACMLNQITCLLSLAPHLLN